MVQNQATESEEIVKNFHGFLENNKLDSFVFKNPLENIILIIVFSNVTIISDCIRKIVG